MVFAVVGNLEVRLMLGSLSHQIGRRPVLCAELARLPALREECRCDVNVPGAGAGLNQALEKAGWAADFLELAELVCIDALHRIESAGGHLREESQTADGEALRDDEHCAYVAAWRQAGAGAPPCSTRSRSPSTTSLSRSGATSGAAHAFAPAGGGGDVGVVELEGLLEADRLDAHPKADASAACACRAGTMRSKAPRPKWHAAYS
jgi:hypothetical protein